MRSLELSVNRLDNIEADLEINAIQVMGDENSMVYEFSIDVATQNLLRGKATVVLMPRPT